MCFVLPKVAKASKVTTAFLQKKLLQVNNFFVKTPTTAAVALLTLATLGDAKQIELILVINSKRFYNVDTWSTGCGTGRGPQA